MDSGPPDVEAKNPIVLGMVKETMPRSRAKRLEVNHGMRIRCQDLQALPRRHLRKGHPRLEYWQRTRQALEIQAAVGLGGGAFAHGA